MSEQIEAGQQAVKETTGLLASMGERLVNYLPTLLVGLVVFFIGMMLAKLLGKIVSRTMKRSKADATAAGFGLSLVRIIAYTLLIAICLSILGVPMASVITMLGAAGVTVGLALQNALSNLAGGFIILFAKPFQAGDYVRIGSDEGYAESVTILYTQLLTRDNRRIYIPNSIVSSGAVVNLSQKGKLRVSVPVSVSYDTDLSAARDVLLEAVLALPVTLKDPAPTVTVTALGESGVDLSVNVWVSKENYFPANPAILEAAKNALDQAGIAIPFPQMDVHMLNKSHE